MFETTTQQDLFSERQQIDSVRIRFKLFHSPAFSTATSEHSKRCTVSAKSVFCLSKRTNCSRHTTPNVVFTPKPSKEYAFRLIPCRLLLTNTEPFVHTHIRYTSSESSVQQTTQANKLSSWMSNSLQFCHSVREQAHDGVDIPRQRFLCKHYKSVSDISDKISIWHR